MYVHYLTAEINQMLFNASKLLSAYMDLISRFWFCTMLWMSLTQLVQYVTSKVYSKLMVVSMVINGERWIHDSPSVLWPVLL